MHIINDTPEPSPLADKPNNFLQAEKLPKTLWETALGYFTASRRKCSL